MKHRQKILLCWRGAARAVTDVVLTLAATACIGLSAPPPKLTVIHQFKGGPSDGKGPSLGSSLVGAAGHLIGVTNNGGEYSRGTVYSLTPPTATGQPWEETILYSFPGEAGGGGPSSPAIGEGGVIYGLATQGPLGYGFVFSLSPPASPGGAWSLADIHDFPSRSNQAGQPGGPLAVDSNGIVYGTTEGFGRSPYFGTVYSLTPPASPGGQWIESDLHAFNGDDGSEPLSGVVLGPGGVLYGTTGSSTSGDGVVFSLTPPASAGGQWAFAALAYLSDGNVGLAPGGLTVGAGGVLYGTTENAETAGSIFSLTPPATVGGAWIYAQLYAFTFGADGSTDGSQPQSPLGIGPGGVLFGVTPRGGDDADNVNGWGTIFSLTPPAAPGGAWTEDVLYRFMNESDGSFPGCVVVSKQGLVYGVSDDTPDHDAGSVWQFTP